MLFVIGEEFLIIFVDKRKLSRKIEIVGGVFVVGGSGNSFVVFLEILY